jgi:hypothetical protein
VRLTASAAPHAGEAGAVVGVVTPRRPRPALVLAIAVALLLAAGVTGLVIRRGHHGADNVAFAPGLEMAPLEGRYAGYTTPGVLHLTSLVGFEVRAPITLLDVRPYSVSRGVETVSRAYFVGAGVPSPSGHPTLGGWPGITCFAGSWPPPAHGESFPIAGLRLATGDSVRIGFFIHAPAKAGDYRVTGYRIRYRTANGHLHTVTGDLGHDDIWYREPTDLAGLDGVCDPQPDNGWFLPAPGYPN